MMLLAQHIGAMVAAGLILSLAAIALTEAEAAHPRGGGAYPASPLGLVVTRLMGWTALVLIGILALFGFGILYAVAAAAVAAYALYRTRGPGFAVARFYSLRLPLSLGAILFAILLWLTFLSLLQGGPHV